MNRTVSEIIDEERGGYHGAHAPRDAGTLIIVDRTNAELRVLLGRRHARHVFLPRKFVFPGGQVDSADRAVPIARPLPPGIEHKLLAQTRFHSWIDAQALALAAIRETFEETGLAIGAKRKMPVQAPVGNVWAKFIAAGLLPDLSRLQFIARAITPPGFVRRFDARFFCVEGDAITHRMDNVVHPDAELTELSWLTVAEARLLDLPLVTGLVLEELELRLRAGFHHGLPVPFYAMREEGFTRELIE